MSHIYLMYCEVWNLHLINSPLVFGSGFEDVDVAGWAEEEEK